jgi:antirestriction protein ArdC
VDEETGEEEEDERFFVLRYFTVFNADQVEGADDFQVHADEGQKDAQPDFAPAEEMIAATGADIRFGGDRAYYRRPTPDGSFPNHREGDFIVMPPRATFDPSGAFYESIAHELAHWAEPRTGWDHAKQGYALGELVAEIASCYVAAELGIPRGEGLGNHAAYLRSWLDGMKGDRNFVFKAVKQASKVTDYLLSFVRKPEPETVSSATG